MEAVGPHDINQQARPEVTPRGRNEPGLCGEEVRVVPVKVQSKDSCLEPTSAPTSLTTHTACCLYWAFSYEKQSLHELSCSDFSTLGQFYLLIVFP